MFFESEERDNNIDTYVFTVRLMKGYNRILLQVGESEIGSCNFLLRITDSKGFPITGLSFTTESQSYPDQYDYDSQVVKSASEHYFLRKIEENPEHIENYIILTTKYLYKELTYLAKQKLKVSKEKFPDCSFITMQLLYAGILDQNYTDVSLYLEEIKSKDPDFPLAFEVLFDEAISIENYREAARLLEKLEEEEGRTEKFISKSIDLANANEEFEELLSLIHEGYERFPDNYDFVKLRFIIERDIKGKIRPAIRLMNRYIRNNYNESAIMEIADTYMSMGRHKRAVKNIESLISNNRIAVGYLNQLARINYFNGNYEKAKEYINKCIKIAPYVDNYYSFLGDTYSEKQKKTEAKEAYRQAIIYNPHNYEAREKLRKLEDLEDIFDSFEQYDVYDIYDNSPDASDYPEDNSIILLDAINKVVYPEGGSQEKHILLVKVFNTSGVDRWKEYYIPIFRHQRAIIEKMEVLKQNGSKIEARRSGSYIVFPNLEEGDAIHLTWKVRNYYSGILSRNFWDMHYFNYFTPVKTSDYSLMVPENRKFKYVLRNVEAEPEITNKEGFDIYVWKLEDREGLKDERYMPVLSEVAGMLHISSFEDWKTIADWYSDLAVAKAKIDFEIKETVKTIFEDKDDLSVEEEVREIYKYLLDNIRYSSVPFLQGALIPQKSSRTLSAKQGDCKDISTLFIAMCKARGIDANLVLISSRDYGVNRMPLPGISFNHAIAKVYTDDKEYYLELTNDNMPFAAGHTSIKNVFALEIAVGDTLKTGAKILNPTTRLNNEMIRYSNVSFEDDMMKVSKENKRIGVFAAWLRGTYKDLGEARQHQRMQESIAGDYPRIKLNSISFDQSLYDVSDTLTYWVEFEVPSVFTNIAGMKILDLPWSDKFENPTFLATDERKYQINLYNFWGGEVYEEVLTIDIPKGKKLLEVPSDIKLSCANAEYSLSSKKSGNQLIMNRKLIIIDDEVKPKNYAEFKEFISEVVRADKRQIAFQ